ncbi:MAG TPA: CehA/McbA family metallohydrolase [Caldilineaceae bacterium]|nr:CehA/McbA family metallohydrolase [Caldilineaceae bacterium]
MQQLPFGKPGRFWKGNLHTHSTRSDGAFTPAEVCRRYRENGYDFIALTDHFLERYDYPLTDTRLFRSDDFTTILGAELHTDLTEMGEIWHILAVGLPLNFAHPTAEESAAALAARARAAGAYVAVAHPNWYGLTERDVDALGMVDAIEVYNGVAIDHNDHADSWHMADVQLGRGKRYLICATDDFHGTRNRRDFRRGWVMVKSETLDPDALLAALKAGHYYSSTGAEIHDITVDPGKKLTLRTSPADYAFISGKGSKSAAVIGNGDTHFEFDLEQWTSPFCRVTVRTATGERAWSNPIWLTA